MYLLQRHTRAHTQVRHTGLTTGTLSFVAGSCDDAFSSGDAAATISYNNTYANTHTHTHALLRGTADCGRVFVLTSANYTTHSQEHAVWSGY